MAAGIGLFAEGSFTTSLSLCMCSFREGLCHSWDTRQYFLLKRESEPVCLSGTEVVFCLDNGCSRESDGRHQGFALPFAILGAEGQSLQVLSQQQRRSHGSTVRGASISFPLPSGSHKSSAGALVPGPVPQAQLRWGFFRKPRDIARLMLQLVDIYSFPQPGAQQEHRA